MNFYFIERPFGSHCYFALDAGRSPGTLHLYLEEYKLWASYTKIDNGLVQHDYQNNQSRNLWFVRSCHCLKTVMKLPTDEDPKTCKECAKLGSHQDGPQRRIVRFVAKYCQAMYLNKKLFSPEEEAQKYFEEVGKMTFARRCAAWQEVEKLSLAELQQNTRKAWNTIPDTESTAAIHAFKDSVVTPCLGVHVNSIDDKFKTLFHKFSEAMGSQDLTVPGLAKM